MANVAGVTPESGAGGKVYSVFDYNIEFKVKTIDGEEHDLSRELHELSVKFSLIDVIPTLKCKLVVPNYMLPLISQKKWEAEISIWAKRGTRSIEVLEIIKKFNVVAVMSTMQINISGKSKKQKASHTYAQVTVELLEKKTATLMKNFVYGIWDWEDIGQSVKVPKVICDIFNQANTEGLKLVFDKPMCKSFEQISVPFTPFWNAFLLIHNHYGLYNTVPIIYSDGEAFYIVNLKGRARKQYTKPPICPTAENKDDERRHSYPGVPDKLDKAVLIHTSAKESIEKVKKETIQLGAYRVFRPTLSSNRQGYERFFIAKRNKSIVLFEEELYKKCCTKAQDLLSVSNEFAAGKNDFIDKTEMIFEDEARPTVYVNRPCDHKLYIQGLYQRALFNSSMLSVSITSPIKIEHFMVGFTYRFLSRSEHFKDLNGRYLATIVDLEFRRKQKSAWGVDVNMALNTASIKDLG